MLGSRVRVSIVNSECKWYSTVVVYTFPYVVNSHTEKFSGLAGSKIGERSLISEAARTK
jgi:hypothetical protein